MYDFLNHRSKDVYTGLYFENEPTIPMKESGRSFRYSLAGEETERNENVYTNVEYSSSTAVIETVKALPWKPETYVVRGSELWRIIDIAERVNESQVCAMVRRPLTVYILSIVKCNNPVGVNRV
ncbi:MAG: hypothetical protein IKC26_02065 [Clostridia bacterium]|nr:hypothetical protein [Clostridia bacterium]